MLTRLLSDENINDDKTNKCEKWHKLCICCGCIIIPCLIYFIICELKQTWINIFNQF